MTVTDSIPQKNPEQSPLQSTLSVFELGYEAHIKKARKYASNMYTKKRYIFCTRHKKAIKNALVIIITE